MPIRAQLRFERGQLFLQGVGQKDKAMQQFIHVLADEAATFELLQTAVTTLAAMEGGFSQAEQCRTLLDDRIGRTESDAERARLLVLRARISSTNGADDDAGLEAAYLEALALNADYGPALLGLAQLMRARGDDQSAFGYFARLLEGSTGDIDEPMRLLALSMHRLP